MTVVRHPEAKGQQTPSAGPVNAGQVEALERLAELESQLDAKAENRKRMVEALEKFAELESQYEGLKAKLDVAHYSDWDVKMPILEQQIEIEEKMRQLASSQPEHVKRVMNLEIEKLIDMRPTPVAAAQVESLVKATSGVAGEIEAPTEWHDKDDFNRQLAHSIETGGVKVRGIIADERQRMEKAQGGEDWRSGVYEGYGRVDMLHRGSDLYLSDETVYYWSEGPPSLEQIWYECTLEGRRMFVGQAKLDILKRGW
jgi:hypothetical protein